MCISPSKEPNALSLEPFDFKFCNDTAEAPCQVFDSVCSRRSHFWHEGKKNDYDQARLKVIKLRFLAQCYNSDPKLAEPVNRASREDTKKDFILEEVAT
ncbi:hypothetical protein QR685DRAFT_555631 [Neurospora intermedia]|uniref:Uncharacterized protein n=1 Tax=Neurospora intermedia TaxID=5142 RepID=A0ABR3D6Y3_NEUIN